MAEEEFEQERGVVGDLASMEIASTTASVPAAKGRSGEDVLALLQRIRQEDPEEPLWTGVRDMTAQSDGVLVAFAEPEEPMLRAVDDVEVACNLFDAVR